MAGPVTPDVATVGGKITAAAHLATVENGINWLQGVDRCMAYQGTTATSFTTATWAVLPFDTEQYDTNNMHSTVTNTSRIVAIYTGLYSVNFLISFATNATGGRMAELRKNAAGSEVAGTLLGRFVEPSAWASSLTSVSGTLDVQLTAGDYIELFGWQSSGGALSVNLGAAATFLQARWVAIS